MRGQLLQRVNERAGLKVIDRDLRQLLIAWFNRGFLTLERINWDSSARVLEKIIKYEAVHQINGWDDLRARLREDRRLFAFFHPAMPDDPLIFVEIALASASASAIQPLLDMGRNVSDSRPATTATFYSINNCHAGLQGISFGNFLIKQVTEELRVELPGIRRFETLSPIPGFRRWVNDALSDITRYPALRDEFRNVSALLDDYPQTSAGEDEIREACLRLCAHYLLNEKKRDGLPLDPVARFHLGNGAYLDRLNWEADRSPAGDDRSFGLMVNYVYETEEIEKNHEAYFAEHLVAASASVRKLLRA